jgi:hypothetical protein
VGSNTATSRVFGGAVGADYLFSPNTIAGLRSSADEPNPAPRPAMNGSVINPHEPAHRIEGG